MDSRGLNSLIEKSEASFDSIWSLFRFNRFTRYMNPAASAAKMAKIPRRNPDMKTKPTNENISDFSGKIQCGFLWRNSRGEERFVIRDSWRCSCCCCCSYQWIRRRRRNCGISDIWNRNSNFQKAKQIKTMVNNLLVATKFVDYPKKNWHNQK